MVMAWGAWFGAHGLGRKAWGAVVGRGSLGTDRWARIVGHGWWGVVGSGRDCFTSSSPPKLAVLSTLTLFFEPVSVDDKPNALSSRRKINRGISYCFSPSLLLVFFNLTTIRDQILQWIHRAGKVCRAQYLCRRWQTRGLTSVSGHLNDEI